MKNEVKKILCVCDVDDLKNELFTISKNIYNLIANVCFS